MRKKDSFFKTLVFFLLLIILVIGIVKLRGKKFSETKVTTPPIDNSQKTLPQNLQQLSFALKKIVESRQGTYSLYFEDFTSGESLGINEEMILTAASVNKIPILAALYYLADRGEIDLERRITLQEKDIQDYGTGSLRYEKPGAVYSLKTLARLMMEKSDNTASYLLGTQIIGLKKIQELTELWGLTQTDMEKNKTSNKDMARLLKLMFENKITAQALTAEMIGFMDDSDFEERLPALLPEKIDVYHKIGNEIGFIHDVGIIALSGKPYYLGVLTSDIVDEEEAKKTIAQISKLVFDYQNINK